MIQIQVPLNKVKINEEIHIKYQTIWETQYNTKLIIKDNLQIEPSVKNIQIIHLQNKHKQTILYRLRTGHNRLNMHLHKIGLHNPGLCDFCKEPETVIFIRLFKISTLSRKFNCLKYQHYQENLTDLTIKN